MFLDFLLLWTWVMDALRLALNGNITAEQSAVLLACGAVTVGLIRAIGFDNFKPTNFIKKLASFGFFIFNFLGDNLELSIIAAACSFGIAVMTFGFYYMMRGLGSR